MSSIQIQSSAAGAGVVTLTSPATATNRTSTLPDATGTLIGTGDTGTVSTTMLAANAVSYVKLLSTDWTNSQGASGYQKLPSGLYIQWGTGTASTTGVTNTFPIAFPTACRAVVALNTNQTNPPAPSVDTFTTTSFRAIVFAGGPAISYIAIGN